MEEHFGPDSPPPRLSPGGNPHLAEALPGPRPRVRVSEVLPLSQGRLREQRGQVALVFQDWFVYSRCLTIPYDRYDLFSHFCKNGHWRFDGACLPYRALQEESLTQ